MIKGNNWRKFVITEIAPSIFYGYRRKLTADFVDGFNGRPFAGRVTWKMTEKTDNSGELEPTYQPTSRHLEYDGGATLRRKLDSGELCVRKSDLMLVAATEHNLAAEWQGKEQAVALRSQWEKSGR